MKSIADYIMVMEEILPENMCESLIEEYEEQTKETKVETKGCFPIIDIFNNFEFQRFQFSIVSLLQTINEHYLEGIYSTNIIKDSTYKTPKDFEFPLIQKHNPDSEPSGWQVDCSDSLTSRRSNTIILFLNDLEEGGELVFDVDGESVKLKPKAGSAVCFPSSWILPYKILSPISGNKYTITSRSLVRNVIDDIPSHNKY